MLFSLLLRLALMGGFASAAVAQTAVGSRTEIPNAAQPQLATDAKGRVWLAYGQAKDVFVARSDDGGKTFAAGVKVTSQPKLMLGMRRGPRLAVQGDALTVTMVAHELLAFHSVDGGKTWSEAVTINEVPTCAREGLHDLASSSDGRLFLTWLDLRNGKMELWSSESADAGKTWGKNAQLYRSPDKSICECCHPTALFDAQGNLAVMWRNSIEGSRDMWMMTRAKGAKQFGAPRKLGEGTWKLNGCPMDGGGILPLGGGRFGAVWQRNGEVFLTRAEGPEVKLGAGKQPIALPAAAGTPVVFCQQGAELVSFRNATGSEVVKVATDGRFPTAVTLADGKTMLLAYEHGPKGGNTITVERL